MFESISKGFSPKNLSTDNDPLFNYYFWKEGLEWNDINEIMSVSYVPFIHPFIERLIGTVRRDFTDRCLFWSEEDAEKKLGLYKEYYNNERPHDSLKERPR